MTLSKNVYLLLTLGLLAISIIPSFCQDGALDQDFDTDGIVPITLTPQSSKDWASDIIVQGDAKIVVVGTSNNEVDDDFAIARLNPDGSLDKSFSVDGRATLDLGSIENAMSVAIQNDHKILVAGSTRANDKTQFLLVRYNLDGTLDRSFGTNGHVITEFGYDYDVAHKVHYLSNGKILVTGLAFNVDNSDFAGAMYHSDGSLDYSFGNNGKVQIDFGQLEICSTSLVQADGKIVLWGITTSNGKTDIAMARLNPDGSLDSNFGMSGKVVTSISERDDFGSSLVLLPNGKIIGVGSSLQDNAKSLFLVRYNTNGSLDNSFGINGQVNHKISKENNHPFSIALQADGKLLVTGNSNNGSDNDIFLVRLLPNGDFDNTFGTNGIVITDFIGLNNYSNGITIQKNNRILVCGSVVTRFNADFLVVRYLSGLTTGNIDFALSTNTLQVYPNPINENAILEYDLIKDEIIDIELFDGLGNHLVTIVRDENKPQGKHHQQIHLNSSLPSGIYILRISNGRGEYNIKLIKN